MKLHPLKVRQWNVPKPTNILGQLSTQNLTLRQIVKLCAKRGSSTYFVWGNCIISMVLMVLFYRAFIESILSFSLKVVWESIFKEQKLPKSNCKKLIGVSQFSPVSLYSRQLQRITGSILNDDAHPLHSEFQLLPSRPRYKNSFVPAAITLMNKMHRWHRCYVIYLFIYFLSNVYCLFCYSVHNSDTAKQIYLRVQIKEPEPDDKHRRQVIQVL